MFWVEGILWSFVSRAISVPSFGLVLSFSRPFVVSRSGVYQLRENGRKREREEERKGDREATRLPVGRLSVPLGLFFFVDRNETDMVASVWCCFVRVCVPCHVS